MSRDSQPPRVRPVTYDPDDRGQQRRRSDRLILDHPAPPSRPDKPIHVVRLIILFICAAAIGGGLASLFGFNVSIVA